VDQLYFESGYLVDGYYTIIREAEAALPMAVTVSAQGDIADATGYYIPDYIAIDYFEAGGQVREADAAFIVTATQAVTVERITQAVVTVSVTVTKTCAETRIRDSEAAFTAAFAPTLTADAFKNHTAVLDSVSTMSVDAVANRSANVLLEHIADLNAMAAKTVDVLSTASTTATQSTTAQKNTTTSLTLNTTVTLTCSALNVQFAAATFTSAFTQFSSRYLGSARPRTYDDAGNYSSTAKYGTASLLGNASAVQGEKLITLPPPRPGQDWVYESYIYPTTSTITASALLDASNSLFLKLQVNSNRTVLLEVSNHTGETRTVLYTVTSSAVSVGAWHHITVVKNSSALSFYIDGSRVGTFTASAGWDSYGIADFPYLSQAAKSNLFLDESSMAYGTTYGHNPANTTITVPTTSRVNDPATTQFLYHWESNGIDDIAVVAVAAAALSTTVSLSAQANANTKLATADLVSQSTVTATAVSLKPSAADVVSATAVTAVVERIRFGNSGLDTVTAVTAVIGSVKQFDCDAGALFAPQITVTAQLAGVALLETVSTVTAQAVKITDVISSQAVTVDQTATITYTAGADLAVTVTADQTATATRIQTAAAVLECVASQVVEIDAINRVSADLVSVFAQTTQALRQRPGSAELSTAIELDAIIEFTHNTTVVIESTVVQTAINDRIRPVDVTASVLTELTATAVKDTDVLSVQSVQAVLTSSAVKTTDVLVDNLVLFTSSFTADITARPLVFLETQSALTAIIGSIKEYVPNSNSGLRLPVQDVTLVMHPNNIEEAGYPLGSIAIPQGYAYDANTISVWIRQEVVGQGSWQLDSLEYTVPYNYGSVTVAQGNITVGDLGFAETVNINWSNAVPNDTDWHHIFLKYQTQAGFYGDGYRLWVDGVDKGYREFQSVSAGIITFVQEYGCQVSGSGYSVAQLRIGNGQITVNDVYDTSTDGFRDLGVTGRAAFDRLSIPGIYTEFDRPWTNIVNGQGAVITDFTNFAESDIVIPVPDMQAHSRFVVGITTAVLGRIEVNVQTSLACTATVVFDTVLNLAVTATETVTATTAIGIVADLPVVFAQDTTVFRIRTADSDLAAAFTQTVQPGRFEQATADLVSTAILDAGVDSIPPTRGEAELSSSFQLTAQATSFTDSITLLVTAGTLTAEVTVIPPVRVEADLVVTASMSVTIGSIEQFAVLTVSSGTLACVAVKTTDSQSPLTVSVTQSTVSLKFTGGIADFTAFNSQLTVGEIINIDPFLQLKIEPETRINKIPQESRVFIIESETRVNIIKD